MEDTVRRLPAGGYGPSTGSCVRSGLLARRRRGADDERCVAVAISGDGATLSRVISGEWADNGQYTPQRDGDVSPVSRVASSLHT